MDATAGLSRQVRQLVRATTLFTKATKETMISMSLPTMPMINRMRVTSSQLSGVGVHWNILPGARECGPEAYVYKLYLAKDGARVVSTT